jgi:hypothetical protein
LIILSVFGLAGFIASQVFPVLTVESSRELLPSKVIAPIQYLFLVDFSALRPWQWLHLGIAILTVWALWMWAGKLRAQFEYAGANDGVVAAVQRKAVYVEILYRLRNAMAGLLTCLVVFQSLLHTFGLDAALARDLPKLAELLRWFYGGEI